MSRFEQLCVVRSLESVYLRVLVDHGQVSTAGTIFRLRIETDPPRDFTISPDKAGELSLAFAGEISARELVARSATPMCDSYDRVMGAGGGEAPREDAPASALRSRRTPVEDYSGPEHATQVGDHPLPPQPSSARGAGTPSNLPACPHCKTSDNVTVDGPPSYFRCFNGAGPGDGDTFNGCGLAFRARVADLLLPDDKPCLNCGNLLRDHVRPDGKGPGGHCPPRRPVPST